MKICYIGEFDFTRKSASIVRVLNNARAIEYKSDFKVDFIGYSNTSYIEEEEFIIRNVKRGNGVISKIYNYITRGRQIIKLLQSIPSYDIIVYYAIYGHSVSILRHLRQYCRKNGIKLIVDVVEWYEYEYLPMGRYGPKAMDVRLSITKIIPKCDGVIAISSYLENYFRSRNVKHIVRIPIIVDSSMSILKSKCLSMDAGYLNLIYAGFPGHKDLILNVALAVDNLAKEGINIRFHILGITKESLQKNTGVIFSDSVVCHGKIEQKLIPQYLANSDFSVIVRSNIRNNKAGFPTKFVESLNQGLPVIGNITSDLGLYLKNNYNGYILQDTSVNCIEKRLKELALMSKCKFTEMRQNAKQTAIDNFDYRQYALLLQFFFDKVKTDSDKLNNYMHSS